MSPGWLQQYHDLVALDVWGQRTELVTLQAMANRIGEPCNISSGTTPSCLQDHLSLWHDSIAL